MKSFKRDLILLFLIFVNLMFIMSILINAFMIVRFDYGYVILIFLSTATVFFILRYVICKKKYRVIIFILTIVLMGTLLFIFREKLIDFISLLNLNLIDLNSKIYEDTYTEFNQYKGILIVIIPLWTVLVLTITTAGFYDFTLFAVFALMVILWFIGFENNIKAYITKYTTVSLLTYSLNSYIKKQKKLLKIGVEFLESARGEIFHLILWSVITATLISILPQAINGKYDNIKDKFEKRNSEKTTKSDENTPKPYNIASSGYDDSDKKLGGAIEIDDTEVMKVRANEPLYLKGTTKSYYDGFTWKNRNDSFIDKAKDELPPSQKGGYTFSYSNDLKSLKIYPDNIKTSTIFVPSHVFNIDTEKPIQYNKAGVFRSKNIMSMEYSVSYYEDKDMKIENIIKKNGIYGIQPLMDSEYEYCLSMDENILSNYKEYLQLPDNLSPRIYDLAKKITEGATTRAEKVEKIYDYLRKEYPYSIDVSAVPQNQEFLDYFLFTEKKGYCTYFATAATILCRISGIPARYVEGFNVSDKKDSSNLYVVTNRDAHAWCEVLIGPRTNFWDIFDCVPNARAQMENQLKEKQGDSDIDSGVMDSTKRRNKNEIAENTGGTVVQNKKTMSIFNIVALIALGIVVISQLFIVFFELIMRYKIVKNSSVIPLYLYYLKQYKKRGYIKPENLSDMEFVYNISDEELKNRLKLLVKDVYAEYYGHRNRTNIDKYEYYRFIKRYLKEKSKYV